MSTSRRGSVETSPFPERHFIGSLCRLTWRWVRQEIQREVTAAGYDDLSPAHVALFRSPGMEGRRPGELAEEMHITKQSVNELLGHLERRGYLVRDRDPDDNRSRRIHLTERGRELMVVVVAAAEGAERTAAGLVGEPRMAEAVATLTDLVDGLGLSSFAKLSGDGGAAGGPAGKTAPDDVDGG